MFKWTVSLLAAASTIGASCARSLRNTEVCSKCFTCEQTRISKVLQDYTKKSTSYVLWFFHCLYSRLACTVSSPSMMPASTRIRWTGGVMRMAPLLSTEFSSRSRVSVDHVVLLWEFDRICKDLIVLICGSSRYQLVRN